jgi:hypothetical protein
MSAPDTNIMSAPDTNIDKQEQRHKPALLGIKGAMVFGALMVLIVFFLAVMGGGDDQVPAIETGSTVNSADDAVAPVAGGSD